MNTEIQRKGNSYAELETYYILIMRKTSEYTQKQILVEAEI